MGDIYGIKEFGYLRKGLDMLAARNGAATANIANSETPGYRAKRVDFEDNLMAAMDKRPGMAETNPGHMPNSMKGIYGVKPVFRTSAAPARIDGNNVNLDEEMGVTAETAMRYQALTTATRKHIGLLLSALARSGGK